MISRRTADLCDDRSNESRSFFSQRHVGPASRPTVSQALKEHWIMQKAPVESFWRSRPGVVLGMLLVIGVFYVVREHFVHVSQALPYLILLLCPLMHLFGHRHGGHRHDADSPETHSDGKRS
jgi:hypothetical protein